MSRSEEEQIEFMNKMLDTYDHVHSETYWNEISPHIESGKGGRILDIGCGPGLLLRDLNSRLHPKKMFGLDLSQIMMEKAEEILQNMDGVELILQNLQVNRKLPDDLDLIFSSRVMRSFENPYQTAKAIFDVLKPGGKFILMDWDRADLPVYHQYFAKSDLFNHDIETYILRHRNFSRYSIKDWRYIMEHAGFYVEHAFHVNEVTICMVLEKTTN